MRKEKEGGKELSLLESPELAKEEDGAPIVFLAIAVQHYTATSRHGLE